ncbi:MAG: hypothetical protein ACP5RZ_04490 [Thermoplasmata archaeon]
MSVGVIGGGFSGLYYGNLDSNSIIYEEHPSVYFNEHCTGLVTYDVVNKFKPVVFNEIYGAYINIRNTGILVKKDYPVAFVIDRKKLEENMYQKIESRVHLNNRIKKIYRNNKKYVIEGEKIKSEHEKIIIADGPRSSFRNLVYDYKFKNLTAIQAEIEYEIEKEYVTIYLDEIYSKGFFAWAVPRKYDVLVGLATFDGNVKNRLFNLINRKFPNAKLNKIYGGLIPIGYPIKVEKNNIYLTGDAGYFNKATSGGGLYYGGISAELIYKSINENRNYDELAKPYKKELMYDYYIHRIYSNIGENIKYKFLKKISNNGIIDYINKYGDIDRPFLLLKYLLYNPEIMIKFIF